MTVAGEIEVALDRVGALVPGQLEGGDRVFRRVVGRAAVGDDERGELGRARRGARGGGEAEQREKVSHA